MLILLSLSCSLAGQNFVTYAPAGRFGDHLVSYAHARWIAYKYDLPFLYWPFKYSDSLMLHEKDTPLTDVHRSMRNKQDWHGALSSDDTLYTVPYFTEYPELEPSMPHLFDVDWHDKQFISELRSLIAPRVPIAKMKLPEGRISIAVHVRKGGGFEVCPITRDGRRDSRVGYCENYGKWASDDYYIEQIKYASKLLGDRPLYVHIFTDDDNPKAIANKYEQYVDLDNIAFGCRQEGNSHDSNVIDDFFNMMEFDCLIMPASNFSFMASKIGNFALVIELKEFSWKNGRFIASRLNVQINDQSYLGKEITQNNKR